MRSCWSWSLLLFTVCGCGGLSDPAFPRPAVETCCTGSICPPVQCAMEPLVFVYAGVRLFSAAQPGLFESVYFDQFGWLYGADESGGIITGRTRLGADGDLMHVTVSGFGDGIGTVDPCTCRGEGRLRDGFLGPSKWYLYPVDEICQHAPDFVLDVPMLWCTGALPVEAQRCFAEVQDATWGTDIGICDGIERPE